MTNCDVCLWGPDDVDNAFYRESIRACRVARRCCECAGPIPPGARYQRAAGKSDGTIWSYTTCLLCAEVREVFYCQAGWFFTRLWDDMAEQAFERLTTASECFQALSPDAKAHVLDEWRRWKGLAPRLAAPLVPAPTEET